MAKLETIKKLQELTGESAILCKKALELREDNLELAEEWLRRHNLAAVMTESARFPKWYQAKALEGK